MQKLDVTQMEQLQGGDNEYSPWAKGSCAFALVGTATGQWWLTGMTVWACVGFLTASATTPSSS